MEPAKQEMRNLSRKIYWHNKKFQYTIYLVNTQYVTENDRLRQNVLAIVKILGKRPE